MELQLTKKAAWLLALAAAFVCAAPMAQASTILAPSNALVLSSGLVGYWPLDGATTNWGTNTTVDKSGNGNTGTLISFSTSTSPVAGKLGQALKFNGGAATNMVRAADATSLNPATVTLSVWIYSTGSDPSANSERIIDKANSGSISQNGYRLQAFNAVSCGSASWGMQWYNGSAQLVCGPSITSTTGKWTHIVFTHDGTTGRIYTNGVLTSSLVAAYTGSNTFNLGIGNSDQVNTKSFTGRLDDVRIYNRALSAAEVAALYKVGSANTGHSNTAAVSSGLVAYWPLDGATTNWGANTTQDRSGQGNTGTLVGLPTSTAPVAGKVGQAIKFNGSTGYITTGYTIPAQSSATSLTWSAWAYLNSGNSSTLVILGFRNGATWIKITPTAFEYSSGSLIAYTIPTRQWVHLTVVKSGSNFTYYANGALVGTGSSASSVVSHTFFIGGDPGFPSDGVLSGTLDDVRVYNRALSATEVAQLYNNGAANVGHSNTAANSGGLVGYWTMDGSKINWTTNTAQDSSGQGNDGTLVNLGTSSAPTQGKVGQALKFNGSTSYVWGTNPSEPSGAVTITAWVKKAANVPWASILDRYGNENLDCLSLGFDSINGTNLMFMWDNAAPFNNKVIANSNVPLNVWTHVAASSDGSTVTFYVNGVNDGSASAGAPCTGNIVLGANFPGGDEYLNGSLDDVRLYNKALSAAEIKQLYASGK